MWKETDKAAATASREDHPDLLQGPARFGGPEARETTGVGGVMTGRITGLGADGEPLVDFPGRPGAGSLRAAATVGVGPDDVGREAVLAFREGNPSQPIILGVLGQDHKPRGDAASTFSVELDGERVVLTAAKEIVLRCGESSITLTKAGKVLIRGTYLSSQSAGVNRIKGGSVQLN